MSPPRILVTLGLFSSGIERHRRTGRRGACETMTERGHRRPNTVLVALMLLASGITAVDQKSAAADGPEAVAADSLAVAGDPPTVVAADTPAATTPVNEGATASTEADETQATSGNEPLKPELESGGRKQAHRQSAQVVITQRMRSQLESLGYGDTDVASLHPVHAAVIVQRGLRRESAHGRK